jgi:hypothetical protein
MAVGTEPNKIVEGVHNRDWRIERKGRDGTFVADLNMLVVAATNTPIRTRRKIATTSVQPDTTMPMGSVEGTVADGLRQFNATEGLVGTMLRTVPVATRNGTLADRTVTLQMTLGRAEVMEARGTRP